MDNFPEYSTKYRDRLRILLIICFFSEEHSDESRPERVRIFKSEARIQKIDFLIRYPSYLAYELLTLMKEKNLDRSTLKNIVSNIFSSHEPQIRTQEMMRFFHGAYDKLDEIILFLKSFDFLEFESERGVDGRVINKKYFLTCKGHESITNNLSKIKSIKWYFERCELIKTYFGDYSASDLIIRQYNIQEYRDTQLRQTIRDIEEETKSLFFKEFGEKL
ncbi:MAG: hypothetical protein OEY10_05915 [Nitrosopumilus sp.]|nr:hypothetical protein [Nitrosopumilus sp.]